MKIINTSIYLTSAFFMTLSFFAHAETSTVVTRCTAFENGVETATEVSDKHLSLKLKENKKILISYSPISQLTTITIKRPATPAEKKQNIEDAKKESDGAMMQLADVGNVDLLELELRGEVTEYVYLRLGSNITLACEQVKK